jgi:hypothetical protein
VQSPNGMTLGPDGALWFTNTGGDSIGRIVALPTTRHSPIGPAQLWLYCGKTPVTAAMNDGHR